MSQSMCIEVPNANTKVAYGAGAGGAGVSQTTDGVVFSHSNGATLIEADGNMYLQAGSPGAMVMTGGIVIGTDADVGINAGAKVQVYAGSAATPNLGSAAGPGGSPSLPEPPCAGTAQRVAQLNAPVALADAAAGIYEGVKGVQAGAAAWNSAEGAKAAFDAARGVYSGAMGVAGGAWGIAQTGEAAGAYTIPAGVKSAISTGMTYAGYVGQASTVYGNLTDGSVELADIPSFAGDWINKGIAALQGDPGASGGAGSGPGGASGATKVDIRGPAGIEMLTDADIKGTAAANLKFDIGSSASFTVANKISTKSMSFSVMAAISAGIKGLASASLSSLGSAKVEGAAKCKVASKGKTDVEAGGLLTVKGATVAVRSSGGGGMSVSNNNFNIGASNVKIRGKTEIKGETTITKKTTVKGELHAKDRLMVKGPGTFYKTLKVSGDLVGRGGVKLG